ncbi:LysR family transcriptional regulator [Bradyrhizobium sp. USDA 4341]
MQVKRLEKRLQAELFHRSTSSVDLSAAGEGLLGYARRILSLNAEAVGRVRAHGTGGAGAPWRDGRLRDADRPAAA